MTYIAKATKRKEKWIPATPNATTRKAMRDVNAGKVKKAKNTEGLFRKIIGK